jgi:signal peptidase I
LNAANRIADRMDPGTATPALAWIKALAIGRSPRWTLVRITVLVFAALILFKYVILLRRIESISMSPTLREGSVHVVNRLAYAGAKEPARGDIVAIRTSGETVMYIKRIIGLPGETLEIRRGTVFINGQPLEEPYVPRRRPDWNRPPVALRSGEYFIIGDNRSMDQELHVFGRIDGARIVGKLFW